MPSFLDAFPRVRYDVNRRVSSDYQIITNILFRVNFLKDILSNISAYYNYTITDSDTPEILAEKVYNDPNAYWIILYANDIYDPHYDWPLSSRAFEKYMIGKYTTVANSQILIHHHEKVIQRTESLTGVLTETRYIVDEDKLTDNDLDVPYDYYEGLAETQSVEVINMDGQTVIEVIFREAITVYDYELALNEAKRHIKVIKPIYYGQIMNEFDKLTKNSRNPGLRRLF